MDEEQTHMHGLNAPNLLVKNLIGVWNETYLDGTTVKQYETEYIINNS